MPAIKIFGIELSWAELRVGFFIQILLAYIIHEWWLLAGFISAFCWALGGAAGGNKIFRRIGSPLVTCGSAFIVTHLWLIFIAIPFMVWLAPAYGEDSFLFKFFKKKVGNQDVADLLTRGVTYIWYWCAFGIVLFLIS